MLSSPDKKAQQNPHGQADQPEAQREEQSDDEGDEGLGAEIHPHGPRKVRYDVEYDLPVLVGDQFLPAFGDLVEVQQDEDQVKQDDDDDRQADDEADGT